MNTVELDRPLVRMPSFGAGVWLNTPGPLTAAALRDRVVLIDFWDYTCVNCVRTLPYLRAWQQRYADKGLLIVGVHAPEFKFAHDPGQIEAAIAEFQLPYPILIDNDYETWQRFANRAWPTKYLVDARGYVRLKRQGEGHYAAMEAGIQQLLRAMDPTLDLPDLLPPLRPEDASGAVCYRPTPELHAGYKSGGLRGSGLGNGDSLGLDRPVYYQLPAPAERERGHFYAHGFWQLGGEGLAFAGQNDGEIRLPFAAAGVNVVLSPTADLIALRLDLLPDPPPQMTVLLDDAPVAAVDAGPDIQFDDDGRTFISIRRPRMYEIIKLPTFGTHRLRLQVRTTGVTLFSFSFVTCVAPPATAAATFQRG